MLLFSDGTLYQGAGLADRIPQGKQPVTGLRVLWGAHPSVLEKHLSQGMARVAEAKIIIHKSQGVLRCPLKLPKLVSCENLILYGE